MCKNIIKTKSKIIYINRNKKQIKHKSLVYEKSLDLIINKIAILHSKNLPFSKYTILGISYIESYYKKIISLTKSFLILYTNNENEIVGFLILTEKQFKANKNFILEVISNTNTYIRLPLIIFKLFKTMIKMKSIKEFPQNILEDKRRYLNIDDLNMLEAKIESIVVSKYFQGRGIGKELVEKGKEVCRKNGYAIFSATTSSLQPEAIKFYSSLRAFQLTNIDNLYKFKKTYTFKILIDTQIDRGKK